MDEEQTNSPYASGYGYSPSQPVGREVGSPVSSWGEIENESRLDREHQFDLMAIDIAKKNGWSVKESRDLISKKWQAQSSHKKADLEDQIKQATWDDDYGKMRQEMAQVNTKNLNAQEKIDDIAQRYAYLAGANDEKISKGYDLSVTSATKGHQSYRAGLQKYLPRGVGIDEIADESGEPDWSYARKVALATDAEKVALREERTKNLLEIKQKGSEALQRLKFGQSVSPEEIEAQRKKDENKAKIKKEYGIVDPVEQLVALAKAGQVPTQQSTRPAATPAPTPSPTPEATPSATPAQASMTATKDDVIGYRRKNPNATKEEIVDMMTKDGYAF